MLEAVSVVLGFLLGVLGGWLLLRLRYADLHAQVRAKDGEIAELRTSLTAEGQARAAIGARLEESRKSVEEQRKLLEDAQQKLTDAFKALSADALKTNREQFMQEADRTLRGREEAVDKLVQPIRETLERYHEAYSVLMQSTQQAQKVTGDLVTALRAPQVRGRWGEMTLQRVVEAAGMSQYCDFDLQPTTETEEGRRRPDMTVHLPGDRTIVVDAKVPLSAYMEAVEAAEEPVRQASMKRHADAVRSHMRDLGSKAYWNQFAQAPDFVVLFLPGESFFSAALEQDRSLIEDGIQSRVVLATPTTLIALLRAVAYGWRQQQMAENAEEIAKAGRELYERICVFARHLADVGTGLDRAARSYNDAVGSWSSRLLPSVRRIRELGASTERELPEAEPVDTSLRPLPASSEETSPE